MMRSVMTIPSMLDIASMNQFLQMTAGLLKVVSTYGASLEYDNLKLLITGFEPSDGPQAQMAGPSSRSMPWRARSKP